MAQNLLTPKPRTPEKPGMNTTMPLTTPNNVLLHVKIRLVLVKQIFAANRADDVYIFDIGQSRGRAILAYSHVLTCSTRPCGRIVYLCKNLNIRFTEKKVLTLHNIFHYQFISKVQPLSIDKIVATCYNRSRPVLHSLYGISILDCLVQPHKDIP